MAKYLVEAGANRCDENGHGLYGLIGIACDNESPKRLQMKDWLKVGRLRNSMHNFD